MTIYGINPTSEALKAATVSEVWVSGRRDGRLAHLVELARRAGVPVRHVQPPELDRLARGGVHQGIVARVTEPTEYTLSDLLTIRSGPPLIMVLDGVEDPQNFGALVRTADAVGVDGVVYQTRRSASTTGAAVKASAGAIAHVRLVPVVNIARAVDELKLAGVWTVGLEVGAERSYCELELDQPTALVLGAEGKGLRRLVRAKCDWLVSIPMFGKISSLNVSVAAGVVLYEARRQRSGDD